ncbi:NYN domain-containing protein [Microbacterium sp. NPDC055683]
MPSRGEAGRPRLSIYIDGFNLYRRLPEKQPQDKWLDLEAMTAHIYPDYELLQVRYFTAIIKTLPGADVQSPQRQQAYIRALGTLSRTTVHMGKFRIDPRVMPVHPTELLDDGSPRTVRVKKTEEKGSDVALASMLLIDAMKGDSDLYVVCSNDSDLVMPMRLVKEELGRRVGLLSPMQPKRASNELKQLGLDDHRQVTFDALRASQLPDRMDDAHGVVARPAAWSENSEGPGEPGPPNQ